MKAVGMALIVYGHVAHATTVPLTPPVYLKQFGVAFFLFGTGYTLARERRGTLEALLNRLFPIYLYGVALAAGITLVGLSRGTGLALSNFMPFAGGANVVVDAFPANPTTWYIGTYLHIVLLWAVVWRRVPVRAWMIAAAVILEIPVRAWLAASAGPYVAYMLFTNWTAVFLLGLWQGAAPDRPRAGGPLPFAAGLLFGLAVWAAALGQLHPATTFPFMTIGPPSWAAQLMTSAAVSALYLGTTALVFAAATRLRASALVQFVSRNSLIIFLAHMPVYLALHPVLVGLGLGYWPRVGVQFIVCLAGLAIVSELVRAACPPERLRGRLVALFNRAGWTAGGRRPASFAGR